ncbi:hypothetical protein BOTBODRAFT_483124 [Botryobasidium botryosum FD-172 SS1]|uniref:Uncharacterized protein n=1 Tax=Botryobasidium botryosum (strain FD-172 SS1) TaxID=930990 RepID=A0A067MWI7_BOTB1|nr:hypothetical protein BOTBODRAFT_483124 [Botryobasidium botryosum FD-172 SS1]
MERFGFLKNSGTFVWTIKTHSFIVFLSAFLSGLGFPVRSYIPRAFRSVPSVVSRSTAQLRSMSIRFPHDSHDMYAYNVSL